VPASLHVLHLSVAGTSCSSRRCRTVRQMQSRSQLAQLAEALGGIPVWGCLQGSRAQQLGMRYGDVILSVNGQRTGSAGEYVAARNLRRDGAQVVIFRDGQEISFDLCFEAERRPVTQEQIRETVAQVMAARLMPYAPLPPFEPEGSGI
jgi:C-terminal processing protease CtpA/Prc